MHFQYIDTLGDPDLAKHLTACTELASIINTILQVMISEWSLMTVVCKSNYTVLPLLK